MRNQFQEIIDSKVDKNDKQYVNVKKKFAEKAPTVIEKIKMQQAEAEARQSKQAEERRDKSKQNGELKIIDIIKGNVPDYMAQSINRPEMQIKRNRMTKDYMQDFFDRNLTRPTMEKIVPQYL